MIRRLPAAGPYAPVTILIQELPGRETQVAYDTVACATVPNGDAAASQIARRLDIEVLGLLHHAAGRAPNCGTSVPENALAQPAGGLERAGPESRRPRAHRPFRLQPATGGVVIMKAISMSPRSGQRTASSNTVVFLHGHQLERNLARAVTAEAVGTFVLVLAITSAAVAAALSRAVAGTPHGSLAVPVAGGLALAIGVAGIGHISDAHLNPAVTLGLAINRRFPWAYAPGYVIAQFAGAIAAAAVTWGLYGDQARAIAGLGATVPAAGVSAGRVLAAEAIVTFVLVLVVVAVATDTRVPRGIAATGYRERHGVSGAKSDTGDAHMLAGMVRTDSRQLRAVAGDSPGAGAVKVVARARKTLIWERNRQVQRLRHQLREYFPAALEAFDDLDAPDALELPARAPDPARAAKLTRAQISAALKRARRRDIPGKATVIMAALRGAQLGQPPAITAAYAATVRSLIAVIITLNEQVKILQGQVEADFGRHPDAEIYLSQPGLGPIPGARVPGESGDDPHRYATGKARKNYAATSPITRASGKKKVVMARFIRNGRLTGALMARALSALGSSPGARALYDAERAGGTEHNAALRKLASRLVGILHGCLKTRTLYDEATAWPHREKTPQSDIAA